MAFFAVEPAPAQKQTLAAHVRRAAPHLQGIDWVHPDDYHVTLKFWSGMDRETCEAIATGIGAQRTEWSSFRVRICELGLFRRRGEPAVLWMQAESGGMLDKMALAIDEYLAEHGSIPREKRAYCAHLTLGRIQPQSRFSLESCFYWLPQLDLDFPVQAIKLMKRRPRRELRQGEPIYDRLATITLRT
jgi:2'-5' RNA ligase